MSSDGQDPEAVWVEEEMTSLFGEADPSALLREWWEDIVRKGRRSPGDESL